MTDKQIIFANEYLIDLNGTRAYKEAYPHVKNDNTAAAAATRLMNNPEVKDYIDKRIKDRLERIEVTQDDVIQELAAIAFANGSDYAKVVTKPVMIQTSEGDYVPALDSEGNQMYYQAVEIEETEELTKRQIKAISGIKQGKNGIELTTYDKVKALELLGKHLGIFKDKVEVSGNINNPFEGLTTEQLLRLAGENLDSK
ncbi:terminase small subunit [uncultured Eubacterium sp.]|uniref:terminase small subunit n=1 Tax=uncultured Eubacterium sp. TaxID=165185 RepID=UPI002045B63E|nr:MAG TPA: Terminase small subunit [Caudoviricetes sp.]